MKLTQTQSRVKTSVCIEKMQWSYRIVQVAPVSWLLVWSVSFSSRSRTLPTPAALLAPLPRKRRHPAADRDDQRPSRYTTEVPYVCLMSNIFTQKLLTRTHYHSNCVMCDIFSVKGYFAMYNVCPKRYKGETDTNLTFLFSGKVNSDRFDTINMPRLDWWTVICMGL